MRAGAEPRLPLPRELRGRGPLLSLNEGRGRAPATTDSAGPVALLHLDRSMRAGAEPRLPRVSLVTGCKTVISAQ